MILRMVGLLVKIVVVGIKAIQPALIYIYCWDNPVKYIDSDGNYPREAGAGDGDGNKDESEEGGRAKEELFQEEGSAAECQDLSAKLGGEWACVNGKYYTEI